MTISEFKAWLEGLKEGMGGNPPTADQWATINAKIQQVGEAKIDLGYKPRTPREWWNIETPVKPDTVM